MSKPSRSSATLRATTPEELVVTRAVADDALTLGLEHAPLRDAQHIAGLLGLPQKTVLQYARDGRLPCVRIGRHVRFIVADVEQAVLAMRTPRGAA